ncbi:MAG: hypothetical protein Q8S33_28520 [Myxococcales bacterium]|nr:hypothetical protein [Myxococcales bacterium]
MTPQQPDEASANVEPGRARTPWRKRTLGRLRREALPLGITAALVAVTWAGTFRIWTPSDFTHPIEYYADANYQLGVIQSARDRGFGSLIGAENPFIGAPNAARWTDFPLSDDIVYFGLGFLSRFTGTTAALNLGYLAAAVLAAVALYLVARRLRIPAPLAALGGALFGASPFIFYRTVHHFNLVSYWPVAPCILTLTWVLSRRGLRVGERRFTFACISTAIVGVHNMYYANYVFQLLALGAAFHLARANWKAFRATALIAAALVAAVFLGNLDSAIGVVRFGRNPSATHRSIGETLLYALRPLELVVPSPHHRIEIFSKGGARYQAAAPVHGEFPSNYLGIIPGLAFIAMMFSGLLATLGMGRRGSSGRFLVMSLWLCFIAIGGGLMQLSQMVLSIVAFRSNNRASIVLLGLAVLFLGRALTPALRRFSPRVGWALAGAAMIFGVWEQSPDLTRKLTYPGGVGHWQMRERWAKAIVSDEHFVETLERELPEGSAVLQLPAFGFPEHGEIGPVYDYEHFRLYAVSHQKLRWSYGAMKGRPENSFQQEMAQLPPPAMVARLKAAGFGAVVFANAAYGAGTAQAFAQQAGDGFTVVTAEAGDFSAVIFPRPNAATN